MLSDSYWATKEMTGTMGITMVPLPSFWSSPKNESDQLRRPSHKEHPCQNPRCAANNMACSTPYKEPPAKRVKRPFKNARSNHLYPVSSNGTRTELEKCGGMKAFDGRARKCADWKAALPQRIITKPLVRESCSVNSLKVSAGVNSKESSKESTTSISSRSNAPSISTPIKSPPNPSKIGLAPLSVQRGSSSTRSSSPGNSQGTTHSLPMCPISEAIMDRYIGEEHLTLSFLMAGRMAPPNSERDVDEEPPMDELDRHKLLLTSPPFDCLPERGSSTSRWPPLPTDTESDSTRLTNLAPNTRPNINSISSNLPPPLTCIPATMPLEANGIRPTPIQPSSPPMTSKSSEGNSDSSMRHGIPAIQNVQRRTTPATKSRESDASTMATMGNAAQMCILEQRLEDEDHRSNSSNLTTFGSDSPKESCSTELSSTLRGANPVSAFYNALYAPDCTLSGTKALEAHLQRRRHSADVRLRVALEIAMFSAMVTMLVVVFYPAITRGLRSHFYGCCSCPVASADAVSRNPSQHYSPAKSSDGCVYKGVRNLLNCPSAQQTIGSTVVK